MTLRFAPLTLSRGGATYFVSVLEGCHIPAVPPHLTPESPVQNENIDCLCASVTL